MCACALLKLLNIFFLQKLSIEKLLLAKKIIFHFIKKLLYKIYMLMKNKKVKT